MQNYWRSFTQNFSPTDPTTRFKNRFWCALWLALQANDSIRYALYQKMDQIILDEAAIVPLYYDHVIRFVQPSIKYFESNGMNMLNLKRVQKK